MVGHYVQVPPYSESLHSFHVNAKQGAELTPNSIHVEGNGRPSAQEVSLLETRLGPAPVNCQQEDVSTSQYCHQGHLSATDQPLFACWSLYIYTYFLNSETFSKLRELGHKSNPQWWRERTPFSQVLHTVHEHGHPDHVSQGCDDLCPGLETGSSEEAEIASLPWPHWRGHHHLPCVGLSTPSARNLSLQLLWSLNFTLHSTCHHGLSSPTFTAPSP